jgi:N-acetylmuramoyl-L-alanine amidase
MTVRQMLVASKNHKIKCPNPLVPEYWTVHNTYNDASANNEVQYMILNQNQVSYHIAIDDKEAVQGIPYDRNAWAAGDGNGPGNRKSLHLEICYSKSGGDRYYKAEENAVQFLAQDLKKRGWGIDRVKKHQDWSGKHCPHRILDEGRWTSFLARVEKAMKPTPIKKEDDDMLDKAIVIGGFPDFAVAEILAARLKAPVYTRTALPGGKIAKEVYVVGGSVEGIQGDKVISLSGADRFAVAAAVKKFIG